MNKPMFKPGLKIETIRQDFVPGQRIAAVPVPEPATFDPQQGPLKAWSASALKKFENCAYASFLQKVKKIPEEKSEAADRGTKIHDLAEQYARGEHPILPKELEKFETKFDWLKNEFNEGRAIFEEDWGFDIDWTPCGWMDPKVWARMKLDAFVFESDTSAIVIDHKTGRKFGNEISHSGQAMIYAIGAFMRFPDLEFLRTEFWYLDKGEELKNNYTREQAMMLKDRVNQRAIKMTSAMDFPPTPGRDQCKWCSYKKNGACDWAWEG
ncbi:MAG: RecB family exonuclease [Cellvibrionaceae bacterium]